jgi:hypothetical protein
VRVTYLAVAALALASVVLFPVVYAQAPNATANSVVTPTLPTVDVEELVSSALSNPKFLVAVAIQIAMGFGLGYVSARVVKYMIAFIAILLLGSMLSVWSLGGSVESVITNIMAQAQQLAPVIKNLTLALGIFTVGPVTLGFILGVVVGFLRK